MNLSTPRFQSEGLGSGLGAFNSIAVLRNQVDPGERVKTQPFNGHGEQVAKMYEGMKKSDWDY